jgi:membrane carboxypeptidase/penicillin-binding protein PbpC
LVVVAEVVSAVVLQLVAVPQQPPKRRLKRGRKRRKRAMTRWASACSTTKLFVQLTFIDPFF